MNKKVYFAAVLFMFFVISGCGSAVRMQRVSDVDFEREQFEVATMAQDSFRVASGMSDVASVGEYSGLTGESGSATLVVTSMPGCYLGVITTAMPIVQTDVAAFELDGAQMNSSLERNDSYRTSGMAVRGFCLSVNRTFTIRVVSGREAMGFVVALYPVLDANAIVRVVGRLQNTERRGMNVVMQQIASGADANAVMLPWAANFPNMLGNGESATSGVPAGATAGTCLLVVAVGSGGTSRDVDLIVHTGEPPVTQENFVAMDDRVNPNAAVAFTVPADPATVRVVLRSYAGGGPVSYSAYNVRAELCAAGAPRVTIPDGASEAHTLDLNLN